MKAAKDLKTGDDVSVIRTSGDIEHDWIVLQNGVSNLDGKPRVLLMKKGTSVVDDITKAPSHETFDRWQEEIANA